MARLFTPAYLKCARTRNRTNLRLQIFSFTDELLIGSEIEETHKQQLIGTEIEETHKQQIVIWTGDGITINFSKCVFSQRIFFWL